MRLRRSKIVVESQRQQNKDKTTMKQTRNFKRTQLTFLVLAIMFAITLVFSGCTTTDNGASNGSDQSSHQGSCH
jgi:hypothetical protein